VKPPYRSPPNAFRADLRAGKRLIGAWSSLANPVTTEILGLAGYDWILLDGEHAPNDIGTFIPQLNALKDSASAPIGRPPWNDFVQIKRFLDAGFHNLLVPFVESADEARRAVAATRYPPAGIRGVSGSQRSNRFGTVPDYYKVINDHLALIVQIESAKGMAAVDEIAAVEGVDGIFVGPADLAAALGHLGNPNHPEVQAAIRHLFERIRAAGKPAGTLTPVEEDARRYLDWGATFVGVMIDQVSFRSVTQSIRDKFPS
jgi:2-dehydro-3-deoxyglucarate aldolase